MKETFVLVHLKSLLTPFWSFESPWNKNRQMHKCISLMHKCIMIINVKPLLKVFFTPYSSVCEIRLETQVGFKTFWEKGVWILKHPSADVLWLDYVKPCVQSVFLT